MYFAYLAAVKEQNGAAMSIGRTSTFIDIYAERDLANEGGDALRFSHVGPREADAVDRAPDGAEHIRLQDGGVLVEGEGDARL